MLGLSVIALGAFLLTGLFVKVLQSTYVHCRLESGQPCPAPASNRLEALRNKPLFFTDYAEMAIQALDQHPYTFISLKKVLPNQLEITLKEHLPVLGLQVGENTYGITSQGTIYQGQLPDSLPQLEYQGVENITADTGVPPELLNSLSELAAALQEHDLRTQSVTWVSKQEVRLQLESGQTALLDASNPSEQVAKLKLILHSSELQESVNLAQELDLRFAHPVLRTSE